MPESVWKRWKGRRCCSDHLRRTHFRRSSKHFPGCRFFPDPPATISVTKILPAGVVPQRRREVVTGLVPRTIKVRRCRCSHRGYDLLAASRRGEFRWSLRSTINRLPFGSGGVQPSDARFGSAPIRPPGFRKGQRRRRSHHPHR